MILSKLEIHNFGIFKNTHIIDFVKEGMVVEKGSNWWKDIIGILAEYANDKSRSNRSGKSLIMESIKYNLVGITRAKKEVDMIFNGEKMMYVTATYISDDGEEYVIKRGRDHKNKGILELNWIQKTTEAQIKINELFGIKKDDFELTNFFNQGDINGFMDKSSSEKTKFLMKWLDNEHWKEKEKQAKLDRDLIKAKLTENEAVKKALESNLEVQEALDIRLEEANTKFSELKDAKTRKEEILEKLKQKKLTITIQAKNISKTITDELAKHSKIQDQIEQSEVLEKKIIKLKRDKETAKALIKKISGSRDDTLLRISSLESEGKAEANSIREAMKHGGTCPILKTSCTSITLSKKDRDERISVLRTKEEEVVKLKKKLIIFNNNITHQENHDSISIKITRYNDKLSDNSISELTKLAEESKNKIHKLKKQAQIDTTVITNKINNLINIIDDIDTELSSLNQEIGGLKNRIKLSNDSLLKIDKVAIRNEKLRTRLSDLNYIVMMFGKNGIPADEIDNSFQKVEDNINYILKELDCGLVVSFSPDKLIDKWEPICHCGHSFIKGFKGSKCPDCDSDRQKQKRDEISLKVLEHGIEKDFNLDSGGGKTIISYAVRIALTMLKREETKSKLNILFLDEVDSALDSHLATQIINSITKVLTKKLGYDQILLVSHKEEIKKSVPYILKVIRHNVSSTVDFV